MDPHPAVCISPHYGGTLVVWRNNWLHKITPKLPDRGKGIISIAVAILGITVISGVCTTLGLTHPIFAYEGDYLSYRTKVEILSPAEIEAQELSSWILHTNQKYKNQITSRPADGVVHAKTTKWINGKPIKVNIVEINPKANSKLEIKPQTASNVLNKKASIRSIARQENSLVAINGGYFKPETGVPLGTLVINKNIYTGPIFDRVSIGINSDKSFAMDRAKINIEVKNKYTSIKVDNINQPRILSTYTLLYDKKWGEYAPPAPKYGIAARIEDGKVVQISYGSLEIPKDGFVIVGPIKNIEPIYNQRNLKINMKLPDAFNNSEHVIGGGPYLVKNGQLYVDIKEQKFGAINGKNPRTAIGYTQTNELIIVTVDGREQSSVGMTLWEIAALMKDLGCTYAMNLDGGGSSVMYVNGRIENSPAHKEGIAISNALVVNEITQQAIAAK